MNPRWPPRGLYLVTPDEEDTSRLITRVEAVLGSAVLLQYRNKSADRSLRLEQASALLVVCRVHGVPLVVNDDADIAGAIGADGVHLGEHDDHINNVRVQLGGDAIIGVSCYDDVQRAEVAAAAGADYLAFGAFFASPTKPNARRATLQLLLQSRRFGLPRVAIGGITPDNATAVMAAGADLIAVISGVFDAPDPVVAARAYASLFH
ncbi:MAG: thiamine phosphate synthase [Lysobacter sp.]|nr:thiamine phosphate synthase [Lysobacter sp.]